MALPGKLLFLPLSWSFDGIMHAGLSLVEAAGELRVVFSWSGLAWLGLTWSVV